MSNLPTERILVEFKSRLMQLKVEGTGRLIALYLIPVSVAVVLVPVLLLFK